MKIFCIGFQKTGTSSMGAALEELGYRVVGGKGSHDPLIAKRAYEIVDSLLPYYDAFQDNPWAILYQYLDRKCPGSKFILTIREPESWLRSVIENFGKLGPSPMREWIYGHGSPIGHEAVYLQRYQRHNTEVVKYFEYREGDLLVLDLQDGNGWERLCPFLGLPIVRDRPFPHRNRTQDKQRLTFRLRRGMRRIRKRLSSQGDSRLGEDVFRGS